MHKYTLTCPQEEHPQYLRPEGYNNIRNKRLRRPQFSAEGHISPSQLYNSQQDHRQQHVDQKPRHSGPPPAADQGTHRKCMTVGSPVHPGKQALLQGYKHQYRCRLLTKVFIRGLPQFPCRALFSRRDPPQDACPQQAPPPYIIIHIAAFRIHAGSRQQASGQKT